MPPSRSHIRRVTGFVVETRIVETTRVIAAGQVFAHIIYSFNSRLSALNFLLIRHKPARQSARSRNVLRPPGAIDFAPEKMCSPYFRAALRASPERLHGLN